MRKIALIFCLTLTLAACQQKQEQGPQYQGRPAGAVQTDVRPFQEAVLKDPKNINAWIALGDVMMDSSRYNEAIDAYTKALAMNPKNVDVMVDLGTCYRNAGKPELALKQYNKAIEINPNHAIAHRNRGVVLAYNLNDKAGGIKELEKFLQLQPNAPDASQVRESIQKLNESK